jgi:peptidoglycan/LPS O-acetylase OafA/YrhL
MDEPSGIPDPAVGTIDDAPAPPSEATPLRVAGFLATVLGAALMGGGAVTHWATIHDPNDINRGLDLIYKGTDVRNGKIALGAAALLLVGLMVLRVLRSRRAQAVVAIVMVAAAVLGIAFSGAFLVDAGHRYFIQPTDIGTLGFGVLMTLAGAVVALLGAILDLAWSVSPH